MEHSANSTKQKTARAAVIAQSLYLCNLLILPGISFFILCYYAYKRSQYSRLSQCHIVRATQFAFASGIFLTVLPFIYWWLTNQASDSFVPILLYFVTFHAAFVLLGMFNLAKAMSRKPPIF